MTFSISGDSITRICFDHAVAFLTSSGGQVHLETTTIMEISGGERNSFDPEFPGDQARQLVELRNDTVTESHYSPAGELVLRFSSGTVLLTPSHEDYEAWSVIAASGERVTCMPGGELAHWAEVAQPDDRTNTDL